MCLRKFLIMFKFIAVKLSVLCRVPCCRNLKNYTSAAGQKCMPLGRNTVAEIGMIVQVTSIGCRLYAKKVPRPDVQAGDIWTELCRANRVPVLDVQNCLEIIELLLSFHYHKNHISRKLSENTVLLKFPVSRWKETISGLQSYGFKGPHFLPLLAGCHALLHGTAWNNLQEMLAFLHSLSIPCQKRFQVIARNPTLLLSNDTRPVLQNYSNLLKFYTKTEAQTLVTKSPSVLTDPVEETNDKINYVHYQMGIRSQEIVRSQVFQYALSHIITRHQFAERAGVYKMPDKHEIAAKEMNLQTVQASFNPSLSDLVDTSNAEFAQSFCCMTVAEYKAFVEMMTEELHEESEDETDSDLSDSDTE